jgi:hypothetical protein
MDLLNGIGMVGMAVIVPPSDHGHQSDDPAGEAAGGADNLWISRPGAYLWTTNEDPMRIRSATVAA